MSKVFHVDVYETHITTHQITADNAEQAAMLIQKFPGRGEMVSTEYSNVNHDLGDNGVRDVYEPKPDDII